MLDRAAIGSAVAVIGLAIAPGAAAGEVHVDVNGDIFEMNSSEIRRVFRADSPLYTRRALDRTHRALHDCGVTTDTFVTFVLADTDEGLSFISLVDDNTVGPKSMKAKFDSQMRMTTVANLSNQSWVNDRQQDIQESFDEQSGARTAFGMFTWKSTKRGDAFAWSNLEVDQEMSFDFDLDGPRFSSYPGLTAQNTFQFVSWDGECWEVIYTGFFDENGHFDFNFTVIPLPPAVLIGAAGLGIVAVVSGRRKKHSTS